jgi:FAD/FMN-containing dehydrogenase
MTAPRTPEDFVAAARQVVGEAQVLTDPAQTGGYEVDWTRRWTGATPAVVRPGSTGEVAELVRLARRHRVALVPQGGNTGLVGGGVPLAGEVVLSLRRLDDVEPVDQLAAQVTVGAGLVLSRLQQQARAAGLDFGVDLGARDSATVGGMVATNAGGLHVMRHGAMRAQVVGLEAVLGTGDVVSRLSGLVKDNTGYDLAQLLCGSEGTLGVVTRARLRLVPAAHEVVVGLLALPSIDAVVALAAQLRRALPGVQALELMTGDGLRRVAAHLAVPDPLAAADAGAYLLVEVAGEDDPTEALAGAVSEDASQVLDAAVASSGPDRERLWRFREAHAEAAAALGLVHKLDVTLPSATLADFCAEVDKRIADRWPEAVTLLFGHVGDGNVHVNVVGPGGDDAAGGELADLVLGLVVERDGSISAEHGIGVAKRRWLVRSRSAADVAAMRAIKRALDPDGILNPHAIFPDP